ncbi:MAG: hypothetical protein LBH75_06775 [Treponema sp.]|jgi:hypothetical protein|nr:hypothetical protein [Treponema sp.]
MRTLTVCQPPADRCSKSTPLSLKQALRLLWDKYEPSASHFGDMVSFETQSAKPSPYYGLLSKSLFCAIVRSMKQVIFLFYMAFAVIFMFMSCSSASKPSDPDIVADVDPIRLGIVSIEFDKFFSSELDKKEVEVSFDPRINAVSLYFSYQGVKYTQCWDKQNRETFISALAQYKDAYATKNLPKKNFRTSSVYGKITGTTMWWAFSFASKSKSYPLFEIGYIFKKDKGTGREAPYFTVLQREALDVLNESESSKKSSLRIKTYFTRSQADELAAFFDETFLLEALQKSLNVGVRSDETQATKLDIDFDSYDE